MNIARYTAEHFVNDNDVIALEAEPPLARWFEFFLAELTKYPQW